MDKETAADINKQMNKMKRRTPGSIVPPIFGLLTLIGVCGMCYLMFTDAKPLYIVAATAFMGTMMFASVVTAALSGR